MNQHERLKKEAAQNAVELVEDGMILGLGSGSTFKYAIEEVGRLVRGKKLSHIVGIPSSRETEERARNLGIPLSGFNRDTKIDLTIDGADEIDPRLNMIKGGGGALLREKIIMQASRKIVVIVDESKLSTCLGLHHAVPVEVLPWAWKLEYNFLESLGAVVKVRQREEEIYLTDQSNYILDAHFGKISDAPKLSDQLDKRAAIMEHGLFIGYASKVIVAGKDGVKKIEPDI